MLPLRRLACRLSSLAQRLHAARAACVPDLWCRPAIVLVLRDPRRVDAPVAGWR